jgi:hypothetical protein
VSILCARVIGAVVHQEHQQAVREHERALPPAAGPPFPPGVVLASRLGPLVARRELVDQVVERGRGNAGQAAEGVRGSSQAVGVAHLVSLQARPVIVQ